MVPTDVLRRDLLVGTSTAGGHTVATDLRAGDFIELLRNRMVLMGMGTQMLTGLSGNIAIPRATGAGGAFWVAENAAPTESQQAFDQVTMSPKTMGAFTDISRKLLLQSSLDVEAFVRGDLATVLALELQRAGINGSGSGAEPRGILNVVGIGSVAGGTNGAVPSFANIVALETEVAQDNADIGTLGYLTNARVRGRLKTVEKASSTAQFLWEAGNTPLNGYRAEVTNAVPSNLVKGSSGAVCSAIIFGNFADLIIGMWGGLDLMVDPYTGSTAGTVRVVTLQDVDIAVRRAESFSAMVDALTT
jgi:HK97 family phage major capsid protein